MAQQCSAFCEEGGSGSRGGSGGGDQEAAGVCPRCALPGHCNLTTGESSLITARAWLTCLSHRTQTCPSHFAYRPPDPLVDIPRALPGSCIRGPNSTTVFINSTEIPRGTTDTPHDSPLLLLPPPLLLLHLCLTTGGSGGAVRVGAAAPHHQGAPERRRRAAAGP